MTTDQELRHIIALTQIRGVGSTRARHFIEALGSAEAVFSADASLLQQAGAVGQLVVKWRGERRLFDVADRELQFIHAHGIRPLVYGDEGYPHRLLDCPDAPAVLFQLGNTDLESKHVVSIVGTRQCTQYGRDCVQRFVQELHEAVPDVIIVSGLALGIDVESHRASLSCQVPTVGVVAHGLDRIYPYQHRDVARQMVQQGGSIVTEYLSGTQPERGNFLARNRIIAGLADAVLVAESHDKGGSLVTASIALDYGRDVFCFPGRVGDVCSTGCNRLIRLNRAGLITSAQDLLDAMGWTSESHGTTAIQQSIPFEEEHLTADQRLIIDALRAQGDLRVSQLEEFTHLEHALLLQNLLDLEMDNHLRRTPAGVYQIK